MAVGGSSGARRGWLDRCFPAVPLAARRRGRPAGSRVPEHETCVWRACQFADNAEAEGKDQRNPWAPAVVLAVPVRHVAGKSVQAPPAILNLLLAGPAADDRPRRPLDNRNLQSSSHSAGISENVKQSPRIGQKETNGFGARIRCPIVPRVFGEQRRIIAEKVLSCARRPGRTISTRLRSATAS